MEDAPRPDLEQQLRDARARLEGLREAARRGSAGAPGGGDAGRPAQGVGTADDERVRAVASGGRLTGLEFDARALRRPPEELAAHIAEAANRALDDLRSKAPSAESEPVVDPAALTASLRDVQEQALHQSALINQSLAEAITRIQARMR
ncbi:hypothetical protein [Spirillospora sp. NPDC047279]|uniref:hypothetical protein n=1 Tax=Spirillospora sp. NPDC047279 TaxID=3155478 RepID=UPI0033E9A454